MKLRESGLLFLSVCLCIINCGTLKAQDKKPNIILILTDDLGYGDVGVFFQNLRKNQNRRSEPYTATPNLDKLAAEGSLLTQYCAAPVCAPSRASLLGGVSQGHANVRDNQFDKAIEDNYTLGNVLQKAGYTTAAIGKWGLQGKSKTMDYPAHPLKRGFNYYYGYIAHGNGHEHYPKEGIYRGSKPVLENYTEVSKDLDKCYTGDLFTAKAKDFIIRQSSENNKPFFLYLAYDTPHAVLELPTQAYPTGKGLNGGLKWLGKPGQMINTASGTPDSWVHPDYANATYDDDNNPTTPEVSWPETYKRYATVTRRIDDQIGDLVQLLKDLNIDENTFLVFTSDNGPSAESYLPKEPYEPSFFNSFGPFDGIKRDVLEGGVRMPAIAWWPGHISKKVVKEPSMSYDWMPTFTALAGLPAPARTDGVSLLPGLTGKGKQEKSQIYVEYFHGASTPDYPEFAAEHRNKRRKQMQMIRLGDFVGLRYNILSADDDFEIYDINKDPQQKNNLAKSALQLQTEMKERVLQLRRPDPEAPRPYDDALVPAAKPGKTDKGLQWKSFQGNFPWLPQVKGLTAVSAGTLTHTDLIHTLKPQKELNYVLEGYINIPSDGKYSLSLKTDGKALVRLHEATLIDADYGYQPGQVKKESILLQKGYHPIRISYKSSSDKPYLNIVLQDGQTGKEVPLSFTKNSSN